MGFSPCFLCGFQGGFPIAPLAPFGGRHLHTGFYCGNKGGFPIAPLPPSVVAICMGGLTSEEKETCMTSMTSKMVESA